MGRRCRRPRRRQKVVVVGGGPAGLEAARVAAARGHQVVLFERDRPSSAARRSSPSRAPAGRTSTGPRRWSAVQCRKLGVDIRLGTRPPPRPCWPRGPTRWSSPPGRVARPPSSAAWTATGWYSAWDVLEGRATDLARVVLVIDEEYGHQGPTTAEFLLDRGLEVDLITSQEVIGNFLGATTRPPLLNRLYSQRSARSSTTWRPQELSDGHLIARNIWSGELQQVGPYDGLRVRLRRAGAGRAVSAP